MSASRMKLNIPGASDPPWQNDRIREIASLRMSPAATLDFSPRTSPVTLSLQAVSRRCRGP
eukprot:8981680-Pyramimonas_sp.AAC.1